jgi:hypothetical protein
MSGVQISSLAVKPRIMVLELAKPFAGPLNLGKYVVQTIY